jgi:hypothetical protein
MEFGLDSLGVAELVGVLEDSYGAGCISVDQIMDAPSAYAIACNLTGKAAATRFASPEKMETTIVAGEPRKASKGAQPAQDAESGDGEALTFVRGAVLSIVGAGWFACTMCK